MSEIPLGYCQCGCGQKTNIATRTTNKYGWIKGEPFKCIVGHNASHPKGGNHPMWNGGKTKGRKGFSLTKTPDHPRGGAKGYVYDYVLRAEKALGRYLPNKAVIHHHTTEQLVVCENQAYHIFLELRTRALKNCGNVQFRKCLYCQRWDDPNNLHHQSNGLGCYHKECRRIYRQSRLARNLMQNGI